MANCVTFKDPSISGDTVKGCLFASTPPLKMYGVLYIPEKEVAISYNMDGDGFEVMTAEGFKEFKKTILCEMELRTHEVPVSKNLVHTIDEYLKTDKLQAGKINQLFVKIASEKESYFGTEYVKVDYMI